MSAFVAGSVKFISSHLFDPVLPESYDNYYRDWLSCHLRENEACSGPELTTQQLCCSCAVMSCVSRVTNVSANENGEHVRIL